MVDPIVMRTLSARNALPGTRAGCGKTMLARESFDGVHVWHNRRNAPAGCSKMSPCKARTKLEDFFSILLVLALAGCAPSPYERGGNPQGLSQRDVERDYMECGYKARFANPQHFYSQSSPFPFSAGSQSPPTRHAPSMDSQRSTQCGTLAWRLRDIVWNNQDAERGTGWLEQSPCTRNARP